MCIIIDANVAAELAARSRDAVPVLNWLLRGRGALIIGGLLSTEIDKTRLSETLVVLDQAGRLRRQDDAKIAEVAGRIDKGLCRSNDTHIIAIAIVSKCRLVYTKDKNLQKDMKERRLLEPVASIYTSRKHAHLLTACECK